MNVCIIPIVVYFLSRNVFAQVRLHSRISHGAVEVYIDNKWALVCADGFNNIAADVVCREVGFPYGMSLSGSAFGTSDQPILMSGVKCTERKLTLLDCLYDDYIVRCLSHKYASVACSHALPYGGYSLSLQYSNYGVVRVKYFDVLGYICPDGFDDNDASVICRELGYNGGFVYKHSHSRYGMFTDMRWLSNLQCDGDESYLSRCSSLEWGDISNCSSNSDAAVYCYNDDGYHLRLTNGSAGRVEMSVDGIWGSVCWETRMYKDNIARVICRELGYNDGQGLSSNVFGIGSGPEYLKLRECTGSETSIMDCIISWKSYCFRFEEYEGGVQCFNKVRLTNATNLVYGRVEVFQNDQWQAICDNGFTDNEAKVVCRELGFADGRSQCCSAVGLISTSLITIKSIKCNGAKSSIEDCTIQSGTCSSRDYASIYCSKNLIAASGLPVRLTSHLSYFGAIEGKRYEFWGPICDVGWNDAAANVTCKQLGYQRGYNLRGEINNRNPMVLGSFVCNGAELTLADCHFGGMADNKCSYNVAAARSSAGVICSNHNDGLRIYLVGGDSTFGRVMITFNGQEGRVCNQYRIDRQARAAGVVCRQLGFADGSEYYGILNGIVPRNKTWFNLESCTGRENSLLECRGVWDKIPWTCREFQVICYKPVRLINGGPSSGIVWLYVNGEWGEVCNNKWSLEDTSVVCKQMGYERGFLGCCDAFGNGYNGHIAAFMDRVKCSGDESSLMSCPYDAPFSKYCSKILSGVVCYNGSLDKKYSSLHLGASGSSNNTGDVQITVSGIVGRICNDGWDDNDAKVVCRELGYTKGQAYIHAEFEYRTETVFLTTMVNCAGDESSLNDCGKAAYGTVTSCSSEHLAGVTCFDTEGVYYRLAGGTDSEGRLEASVDGKWGTVCNEYLTMNDISVYCRSIGFKGGNHLFGYGNAYSTATGIVYKHRIRCIGNEKSLTQCPHSGWEVDSTFNCRSYPNDVAIKCNGLVQLLTTSARVPNQGQVLIKAERADFWYVICDTGFTDVTAKIVCKELGYPDGRAICCSAYSTVDHSISTIRYSSLSCMGNETSVAECLRNYICDSDMYASVVCFEEADHDIDESYTFSMKNSSKISTEVVVKHYDVIGRVSSINWTDTEARVFCKENGYPSGIAYHQTDIDLFQHPRVVSGPFWISNVHCIGDETSITDCSYNSRLELGNTKDAGTAGVLCLNDAGIQYRLKGGGDNYGRVELSLGGVWGTVCNFNWDSREAGVLCRQLNFSDGYAAYYGSGSGPIWLSFLQCKGSESFLHRCLHDGFNDEVQEEYGWSETCQGHDQDASVFCIGNVRLHSGLNKTVGAVEVYVSGQWSTICDTGFSKNEANVVCRNLGFRDGRSIAGSAFGTLPEALGVSSVVCDGSEADLQACSLTYGSDCLSSTYVSVYCSPTVIIDTGFETRLKPDVLMNYHGLVEVKVNGIWGSVSMDDSWDDSAATVVCKNLSYAGGVAYQPNGPPMPMTILCQVQCKGSESSLEFCQSSTVGESRTCLFTTKHAGAICYKSSGIQYRLQSGTDKTNGRFEISLDGQWGGVCNTGWGVSEASVACRSLGFVDGLPVYGPKYGTTDIPVWLADVMCTGSESTVLRCKHLGFNNINFNQKCRDNYHNSASVQCYSKQLKFTNVRLTGGNSTAGTVEVYLEGPDHWGRVCNKFYDAYATFFCNQLGYARGSVLEGVAFGKGTDAIWMIYFECSGHESKLTDCPFEFGHIYDCSFPWEKGVSCTDPIHETTISSRKPHDRITVSPTTRRSTKIPGGTTNTIHRTTISSTKTPSRTIEGHPTTRLLQTASKSGDETPDIAIPVISVLVVIGLLAGVIIYRRKRRQASDDIRSNSAGGPVSPDYFVAKFSKTFHNDDSEEPGFPSMGTDNPRHDGNP